MWTISSKHSMYNYMISWVIEGGTWHIPFPDSQGELQLYKWWLEPRQPSGSETAVYQGHSEAFGRSMRLMAWIRRQDKQEKGEKRDYIWACLNLNTRWPDLLLLIILQEWLYPPVASTAYISILICRYHRVRRFIVLVFTARKETRQTRVWSKQTLHRPGRRWHIQKVP